MHNLLFIIFEVGRLSFTLTMSDLFSSDEGYEHRDDDFIFEDFARLRLKGHDGDDTEA